MMKCPFRGNRESVVRYPYLSSIVQKAAFPCTGTSLPLPANNAPRLDSLCRSLPNLDIERQPLQPPNQPHLIPEITPIVV